MAHILHSFCSHTFTAPGLTLSPLSLTLFPDPVTHHRGVRWPTSSRPMASSTSLTPSLQALAGTPRVRLSLLLAAVCLAVSRFISFLLVRGRKEGLGYTKGALLADGINGEAFVDRAIDEALGG